MNSHSWTTSSSTGSLATCCHPRSARRSTDASGGRGHVPLADGARVSEPVGHPRRRVLQQHLVAEHLRAGGFTSLIRRRPGTSISFRSSTPVGGDQAGSRGELGLQRTADRRKAQTSPEAVAIEINDSKNITVANYHAYRVTEPTAVRRRCGSRTHRLSAFATCTSSLKTAMPCATPAAADGSCARANAPSKTRYRMSPGMTRSASESCGARCRRQAAQGTIARCRCRSCARRLAPKLESGFSAIAGATVDPAGTLYFRGSSSTADLLVDDGSRTDRRSRRATLMR